MYAASNNRIREDVIFTGKVKAAIVTFDGTLVPALEDFQQRHAAAVKDGKAGLSYTDFMKYLREHGVGELNEFEVNYLCNAFDDGIPPRKNLVISASTFERHLTGLNSRRLRAVQQAWAAICSNISSNTGEAVNSKTTVPADALMDSYRSAQLSRTNGVPVSFGPDQQREAQLQRTFAALKSGCNESAATPVTAAAAGGGQLSALLARSARGGAGSSTFNSTGMVNKDSFLAFYAGLSPASPTDADFEAMLLREWAADPPQRPRLAETERDWGVEGDPLAVQGTHYVQDALRRSLGISGKAYDYTHMAREHPYVEPLAPLDRVDLMESVAQRTYVSYDEQGYMTANPLATRHGQVM